MERNQPQNQEGQNNPIDNIPEGFVFIDNESPKQFFLKLTPMLCPSDTIDVLHLVHKSRMYPVGIHQKTLAEMLRVNIVSLGEEIEEPDTN